MTVLDTMSAAEFRRCVGQFPTGVTVVTVDHESTQAGMTVNSFTSVSLEPLLVSVCLASRSRTLGAIREARRFAISILRADQREVAQAFATRAAPFPATLTSRHPDGHVSVSNAVAVLRCSLDQSFEAGDHDIVIGRVDAFEIQPGDPLVFLRGEFH